MQRIIKSKIRNAAIRTTTAISVSTFQWANLSKSVLAWLEFNSTNAITLMVMQHHSSCEGWQGLQDAASRITFGILLLYPLQEQRAPPSPSKHNPMIDAVLLHIFRQITHFKTSCGTELDYQPFLASNKLTWLKPQSWKCWRSTSLMLQDSSQWNAFFCKICWRSQHAASRITLDSLSIYCISCKNKSTAHPSYPNDNYSPLPQNVFKLTQW